MEIFMSKQNVTPISSLSSVKGKFVLNNHNSISV